MKLSPGDRAALNRHLAEIRKILRTPAWPVVQIRLNVNENLLQSVDYKLNERIQVESAVDTSRVAVHS